MVWSRHGGDSNNGANYVLVLMLVLAMIAAATVAMLIQAAAVSFLASARGSSGCWMSLSTMMEVG